MFRMKNQFIYQFIYFFVFNRTGTETKFAGSSCNDLVTSDGAGSTIISGHFDKRIRFWDIRTEMSANHIVLQGKVTSLDLSRGNVNFFIITFLVKRNTIINLEAD